MFRFHKALDGKKVLELEKHVCFLDSKIIMWDWEGISM